MGAEGYFSGRDEGIRVKVRVQFAICNVGAEKAARRACRNGRRGDGAMGRESFGNHVIFKKS